MTHETSAAARIADDGVHRLAEVLLAVPGVTEVYAIDPAVHSPGRAGEESVVIVSLSIGIDDRRPARSTAAGACRTVGDALAAVMERPPRVRVTVSSIGSAAT